MIARYFKSSIGWRLQAIILGIVLVMSTLCGYVYYYKTRDNRIYERLLSNLSLINNTPRQVSVVVGDIMLYQKSPDPVLEARIFTTIDTLIGISGEVLDGTDIGHADSIYTSEGIRNILGNLKQISRRTIDEIKKGTKTIELYENIDLLNILIEVVRKNVSRYVSSELAHAIALKNRIATRNATLGLVLFFFITLNILFVAIQVAIVRKSIIRPIRDLEKYIKRFQSDGVYTEIDVTTDDEVGSLTAAFDEMTREVQVREQALQKSEKKYRLLADNANDVIFVLDMSLNYTYVSPSIGTLLGYEPGELVGQSSSATLTPDAWGLVKKSLLETMENEDPMAQGSSKYQTLELEMRRKDGTTVWTEVTFSSILNENSQPQSILGVTRNIHDRVIAEQEQEQLQAQLTQAQKMESVGRLAGGISHDFNNMLSIIIGNCEVALADLSHSHPAAPKMFEILKAANRSAILTRQLLAFARRQTVAPKVIDLNQTVKSMLSMLQRLIGEDIALAWLPKGDLWPAKIDPTQVDQILANLCVNARDAIKDIGKVTIETDNIHFDEDYCRTHTGFRPGSYVLISVSDDGSGMDKETLTHLFEPFFTTKEIGKGTGLGLATVYGIVKQNNGFVNVYSEIQEGTTFKVYLPKWGETIEYQPEQSSEQITLKGVETILLVEDEQAILDLTEMMLERMGYTVLAASTPGEAMQISHNADEGQIQLIMTDVVMPEMNGRDLVGKLLQVHPNLKCLFMSGYTYNVIAHHGILEEGLNYISKPFSMQELSTKLREVLD